MRFPALFLLLAAIASAHPMGNLSVNHYARLETSSKGVQVTYVLDLAEIPTFELMQNWGLEQSSPKAALDAKARSQAADWAKHLRFSENGKRCRVAWIPRR